MEGLRAQDLREILAICGRALSCNSVDQLRGEVLEEMAQAFRADSSNFFINIGPGLRIDLEGVKSRGIDQKYLVSYKDYYYRLDPFQRGFSLVPYRSVITMGQLVAMNLRTDEYLYDFLEPQSIYHQMAVYLKSGGRISGVLALFRPKSMPDFSYQEIAKAELLAPYLAGALKKTLVLEQTDKGGYILNSVIESLDDKAIVILNEFLEPIFKNKNATEILAKLARGIDPGDQSSLSLPEELHKCCQEFRTSLTHQDISESCAKELCVEDTHTGEILPVRVSVINSAGKSTFFLICFDTERAVAPPLKNLSRFGISPREMEIVTLVYQGCRNTEIAEKLFISKYTVENHLKNIFQKMEVKNRTSLINRLIRLIH